MCPTELCCINLQQRWLLLGDCCKFAHSKADWGKLSFSVWDVAVLSTELQCHLNEMARSCLNRSPPQSMSQTWVASLLTLQRFPAVEAIQVSTFLQGVASFIASYLAIRIRAEILVMWFLRSFILNFMPSTWLKITTVIAFSASFKSPLVFFWIAHVALPQAAWQAEKKIPVPFCHIQHQFSNSPK